MKTQKFKTKLELFKELGLSKSSFYRLKLKKNIKTTPKLLTPKAENDLRVALDFPPLPDFKPQVGQIGTDWDTLGQID